MIKIYSIIFIKSCKLRTVRSLPGKGNLILRGVFPSSVEIIVIRRHSVDRTRWLAAYYRANQQSRWRWRHAGLLDADWWGVERLSFYIVSQSLAGSVGIRKRTRHYLEYIVTRRYIWTCYNWTCTWQCEKTTMTIRTCHFLSNNSGT